MRLSLTPFRRRIAAFLHVYQRDGRITSICRDCQATVAIETNEIDLHESEKAHGCAGLNMHLLLHPQTGRLFRAPGPPGAA